MNGFLLDTNVISDLVKGKRANTGVTAWLARNFEDMLYLSSITLGEIEKGLVLAEAQAVDTTRHRVFLEQQLPARFRNRILAFDARCAKHWGQLLALLGGDKQSERALAIDAQIAAIAFEHKLTICTRNQRDFSRLGVTSVINPFT